MIRYLAVPAVALLVASCAPLSEDECRGGDWGSLGLDDGKKGRYASVLEKYAEACAEFGVAPDQSTYLQARASGLKFYCTPENAYSVGRKGGRLNKVCSPEIQASLLPAFRHGERYHEIDERIDAIDDRIDELQDELNALLKQPATPEQNTRAIVIRGRINDLRHDLFMLDLQKDRFASYP